MFKAIRIAILLFVLFVVSVSTWLTQARSTDWNNTLWVTVYPINADGSDQSADYISDLKESDFSSIEEFLAREIRKYGHELDRPLRMALGREVREQPPALEEKASVPQIMLWSLRMRWWAGSVTSDQDGPPPDVRVFVRYHSPRAEFKLENSVGLQKGMVGIVNAFADRRHAGINNVVIAHEFLHTLGATDKYDPASGMPDFPHGFAEPERNPRYPQRLAEIMGGRIAESELDAMVPKSLKYVIIGRQTANEIKLLKE
ncbi:MAG: hypothetical protein OEW68_05135 [Gammaproteobacteria bacterium]|nr:hypothetical protein [Gammaproteobacteria bacterium]MDH4314207.1 hypothetical protein [Gammaproteobacteria bacterium]MDH5213238.1 hypothetical protein [Gammaproteobacteria bacterium]